MERYLKLATLGLIACLSTVGAGTLYWAPGGVIGGSGTWDTATTANWSPNSGGGSPGLWNQTGGQDIADIVFTGANQTVTISGAVNANRVIVTSSATANGAITGGTLNLGGDATIEMKSTGANQWITLATAIIGSNGLAVTGAGSLILGGVNTYTGMTTLNNGRVVDLISSTAIPSGSILNILGTTAKVRIPPGVSVTAAGLTGTALLTGRNAGDGTLTLSRNDGGTSTFDGRWREVKLNLVKDGNYTQILGGTLANDNPNVPSVAVYGGVLALAKTAGVDAIPSATITVSGGTLRLDAANQINDAATLTLTGGSFNLQSFNETVAAVSLQSGSIVGSGTLTSLADFDVRSGTVGANLAGGVGLTKTTAGTVVLNGANSYTGATTVNAGTLRINGSLAGPVTVNAGSFGGTGTLGGDLTVAAGATLAPGNSAGQLDLQGNDLDLAGLYAVELGAYVDASGNTYDQVVGIGELTLGASSFLSAVNLGGWQRGQWYPILQYDSLVGSFGGWSTSVIAIDHEYVIDNVKWVAVQIPEPASAMLLALGGLGLARRRRLATA